ncbi:uncharacterized protein NP_2302A [Natronomonas pharaonis DSM 2160]|uniref:Uncharacterized protein n=1 Tax=Natronomonas pharaonis (strain ATCC 35678 / DSM 2160 / CIP 103997 / JCM 8858 / NBRC 14720 / NCIMB 2260 / Gabara) TaxID=348780 RepID=A0A1U7EVZ9_NATPD|nr:hypothetical protein [Natronomonas pharaonis]CAI49242.1 uncharacterized protein NP_2302A [Natronomonas pharaonis DSM 2160]
MRPPLARDADSGSDRVRSRSPGVDAGLAAATVAACVLVSLVPALVVADVAGLFGPSVDPLGLTVGVVAAGVVVLPAAFGMGWFVRNAVPAVPGAGILAGGVATAGTYACGLGVCFLGLTAAGLVSGAGLLPAAADSAAVTAAAGGAAVAYTGWLAFPLGCLGGRLYTRTA